MADFYNTHNPSCTSKLKYCCGKKFGARFLTDIKSYYAVHPADLFFNILTTIWLLTGTILFAVAIKTNNLKHWIWLGVIAAVVPFGLWLIVGIMGLVLYCRKIYLESSDELCRESNPNIYATDSFILDPFTLDVVDSKIIRI